MLRWCHLSRPQFFIDTSMILFLLKWVFPCQQFVNVWVFIHIITPAISLDRIIHNAFCQLLCWDAVSCWCYPPKRSWNNFENLFQFSLLFSLYENGGWSVDGTPLKVACFYSLFSLSLKIDINPVTVKENALTCRFMSDKGVKL